MEQVLLQEKRLGEVRRLVEKLSSVEHICKILEGEQYLLGIQNVESTVANTPRYITLFLNEQEQAVLAKSILVVLDFAKQRMERELEQYHGAE